MNNEIGVVKKNLYDLYLNSIIKYNNIKVVTRDHDFDSEQMMSYFTKQRLKKKNFKKE